MTVLAGCFCTASDLRPVRDASPTVFRLSFCSAPPLAEAFLFRVGDVGAIDFVAPFGGAGEIV